MHEMSRMIHSGALAPSNIALQKAYSIASSAVASNLACFALDEISHDNQFREIRDREFAIATMIVYRFLTKKTAIRNTT